MRRVGCGVVVRAVCRATPTAQLMCGAGGGSTDYQSRARENARGTHARSNCAGSRGVHGGWAWNEATGVNH